MAKSKSKSDPVLLRRLRKHFDSNPAELPVIEQSFAIYERPNLHLAIEELLLEPGRDAKLLGIIVSQEYDSVTLSKLSRKSTAKRFHHGPVEYVDVPLADGRS
jgi:hypothetical protein